MKTSRAGGPADVKLIFVRHASSVAAISSSEGPARLLEAGLAERLRCCGCDVQVVQLPGPASDVLGSIARSFATADAVAQEVKSAFHENRLPIVLSGSCHTALGTVSGLPTASRGVVWLDSHADFNTPDTSPSGLLDGTTLATMTGRCWSALSSVVTGFFPIPDEAVVMLGVRDLDPGEASLLAASAIASLSPAELDGSYRGVLDRLRERVEAVYVHLDLDVLDPAVGMANEFAAPDGLSARQLSSVLEHLRRAFPVRALALTSYDPRADADGGVETAAIEAAAVFAGGSSAGARRG